MSTGNNILPMYYPNQSRQIVTQQLQESLKKQENTYSNKPQSQIQSNNDSPQYSLDYSPTLNKPKIENMKQQQNIQQEAKNKPAWQTTWHYRWIQYWQTIFNRRVISFSSFALQVGDIIIFTFVVAFLIYCCLLEQDTGSSGSMAQIMMAATIVFGCRNGLLSYLFGLSLERAVLWHQLLAWITLGLSFNHWFHSDYIVSGFIIQGAIMGLILFSLKPVRRYLWEFFMKMHWILIVVMIVGCIAHGVTLGIIASIYFILDVLYRFYTVYQLRNISKEIKLERIGNNITKISLQNRDCQYKGGQYFFIMIPKLSYFQWHPFSVFSASYEEEIVFYVKTLGDWTNELYRIAGETGKPNTIKGYLDGPYGFHSISIEGDKYQNFLCVSGGIGVTPIISTAKEILNQIEQGRPIKSLYFIWTGRDSAIVESIFKPDELKQLLSQDDAQILKTFYHYSSSGDKKIEDIELKSQKEQQQLVKLDKGRPDFSKYFEQAFNSAKQHGQRLVGVLTCGPQQLINTVEVSAMKWSKDGIRFDVHQEVFDF